MGSEQKQRDFPPAGFLRFWSGEAVSGFGSYVSLVAIQMLVVLTLDGSAFEVGLLNSARWIPYLLLGLVVGALVERCRRRPVMVVSDLVRAVLMTAIPVAWTLDVLSLPLLLLIVASYGTSSLFNDAASMAFLPRLIPRRHLQRAHARTDGADAVAQTSGPPLAGVFVSVIGAPLTMLVDAATHLFSATMVATLTHDEVRPDRRAGPVPHIWREIAEGVRWIYRDSGLAALAVGTHIWFVANAILGVAVAPYALRTLGLSPLQFGVATALAGVGAFVGAGTSTAIGQRFGTGGAVILSHCVTVVGVSVMALAGIGSTGWVSVAVLGVGQIMHGFAMGLSNSHATGYRQAVTPDALQARTNITMRSFNRAVIVIVAPLAGLLADQIGLRAIFPVAAAVFAVSVLVLAASPFRRARIDAPVEGHT